MNGSLNDNLLSQISEFIAARTALYFPRERYRDLERQITFAAGEFGFADSESFIRWLTSTAASQAQIEMLASYLTISETYFWREPKVFDALIEHILPQLVRMRQNSGKLIRIWSAGCSTGEEPYSIAIALHQVLPVPDEWNITLLATDINPRILQKAKAGRYGKWSFRNAPTWLIEKYFLRHSESEWEILPELKKMVTFSYLNLAEDIYPSTINNTGAMDIIFCRNVLMYFAPDRARKVAKGLFRSLTTGGWLTVSASELSSYIFPQFYSVHFPGAILYRKDPQDLSLPSTPLFAETASPAQSTPSDPALPPLFADTGSAGEDEYFTTRQTSDAEFFRRADDTDVQQETPTEPSDNPAASITDEIRSLADGGNLPAAIALCDKAIAGNKLDPGLHYLRAVILQEQDNFAEAVLSIKRTLYLEPNHALAHFTLGNLMFRLGNAAFAQRCFTNVLELTAGCNQDDILPESGGLTTGRFREIIQATINLGAPL